MDDDELQMLQRELMAVQQQKTNPLSERTVAEIMVKLHRNQFPFYPTTDGNEYVTPERLDKQIATLVKERNKIQVGLLPQILNINIDAIQFRIVNVLKDPSIMRHNNYLLSRQQINSVISAAKQRLQIEGKIDLEEIALNNEFNMVFTRKIIEENLADLNAELIENQLITNQFRLMQKSRILGFLNGISKPIHLDTLQKSANLQERKLQSIIEELIGDQKLAGKCQNSYFIPTKFAKNQKRIINKFFDNNGYIQFSFLQKNFITSKQEDWLNKNLGKEHVCFQGVCFSKTKLEQYETQLNSLLKGEGLIEISSVLPFELNDRSMHKFLSEFCKLNNFVFNEGYCYSQEWLDRCAQEFREKVIYNIFFKKVQQGKKKTKKNKELPPQITEEQLIETLFDAGLAQYSVLQDLAPVLLPVLNSKLDDLRVKLQKQLAQSKGIINTGFLKYRRCKTIVKTQQNLTRYLNTAEKQKKKGGKWEDPDFGPSEKDKTGLYSLIYYDGILQKNWPPLQDLKWEPISQDELSNSLTQASKSLYMKKCLLPDIISIMDYNIRMLGKKIEFPLNPQFLERKQSPFVFQFWTGEKQRRFVLVDDQLPRVNGQLFGCNGLCGLIEKAYSKLRYCYRAILSVGIQQLIFELTGRPVKKISSGKENFETVAQLLIEELKNGNIVILMAEGQMGNKISFKDQETPFECLKPYSLQFKDNKFELFPSAGGRSSLDPSAAVQMFMQAYIF